MFLGLRKLFFTSGGYTPTKGGFYDYAMSLTPVAYWRLGEAGGSNTETLEHHYELDETTGTVADDSEGIVDAAYVNSPTLNQTALDGGAGTSVWIDTTGGYASEMHIDITSSIATFDKGDGFQIEFYMKTNEVPTLSYKNVFFAAVYDDTTNSTVHEIVRLNMDQNGAFRLLITGEPWDDAVSTSETYGSGYNDNSIYKIKLVLFGDGSREFYVDDSLVSPTSAGSNLVVDWDVVDKASLGAIYVEEV